MPQSEVRTERSTWSSKFQQALTNTFEQWTNSMSVIKWVSRNLVCDLQDRGHCPTFCPREDNFVHGYEKILLLGAEIDQLIPKMERSTKIATSVHRYNQLLD